MIDPRGAAAQLAASLELTRRLPAHAHSRIRPGDAVRNVRARLATRERALCDLVRRAIFARRASPYRRLFHAVGCTNGDFEALVQREGVEGALAALEREGVWLSTEELKGRRDIIRGSLRFRADARQFANPLLRPCFHTPTSGSTGRPLVVGRSMDEFFQTAELYLLTYASAGVTQARHIGWRAAPNSTLWTAPLGWPSVAWLNGAPHTPWHVRAWQQWFVLLMRLNGNPVAPPRDLPFDRPDAMLRLLLDQASYELPVVVSGTTSCAVRVSQEAVRSNQRLDHVIWNAYGEALTPARVATIRESGSRVITNYSATEAGGMAYSCSDAKLDDDMHLDTSRFAAILGQSEGPASRPLLVTAIVASAPLILINVSLGDTADVETRDCRCVLAEAGLTTHLSNIRSVEKLTGEGVTFLGIDLAALVEARLPAMFGGGAGDYQVAEQEVGGGTPRIAIRVDPGLGDVDEEALRAATLAHLAAGSPMNKHMAGLLDQAGSIQVERRPPIRTATGKIPCFVPLRGQSHSSA